MRAWLEPLRRNQRSQKWAQRARSERQKQCFEALSLLQRYIDGELDPSDVEVFEQHLDACRACGLELRVYLDIKSSLADRREDPDHAAAARLRQFTMRLRDQD
ncbi:anti-sigma factor family protein [Saccharopolyspora mangrovi]|uniref:Zf-HC2 domain-containing protein n=1 Tax=Saccharopolyspora mangrovi TaxID=3082379 RepID=A0ABU6AE59_9PSEU|nr:zf-HC2 domain-containing protein [Saccharopolyspora sp. S2-29]MEB3369833.1 zf-HC2 domain-containing protein [Saccharopolyspora sp. S2-29]